MKTIVIILFLASFTNINAQSQSVLEHNNTRAYLPTEGMFFRDVVNNTPGYEVPKGDGIYTLYTLVFQYAAKTAQDSVLLCQGGFSPTSSDVQSGPYRTNHNYDSAYQTANNNKFWKICQEEIDIYSTWWEACEGPNQNPTDCGQLTTPSNDLLTRIYEWPVHGDVNQGEAYWQAPFYDHPESSQGVYDPAGGDYPLIRGCCATYLVQNDDVQNTISNTPSLGIEMHYMFYHYQNWGTLNDVTFAEVRIINYSGIDYPEFTYGLHADMDLGNPLDDYFGSDSLRSMAFTYNGDQNDENFAATLGYGLNPPAFGITALETPLTSATIPASGSGLTAAEYWNQMNGLYPNGQAIVTPQGDTTKFLYNGNPHFMSTWSEESLGNPIGDRRALIQTNHGSFVDGEEILQTYALVFARDGSTRLENVDDLFVKVDEVHDFYDTINNAQCSGGVLSLKKVSKEDFTIAPNPSSSVVNIESDTNTEFEVSLLNASGKVVMQNQVSNNGTLQIQVDSFENGLYFLVFTSKAGRSSERLIIQH